MRGDVPITVQNLADYLPSEADANVARAAFVNAGFQAGDLVGISFSITAPASRFKDFFGSDVKLDAGGRIEVSPSADSEGLSLPLDRLARDLAERLVVVTFSAPADLHQGGSSMMV